MVKKEVWTSLFNENLVYWNSIPMTTRRKLDVVYIVGNA